MNHVHVGFKTELSPDFDLPDDLAAGGAQPAAPAARRAAEAVGAGAAPAAATGSGESSLGAAALRIAQTQRGVRETGGANTGPQVDEYLAAAGVPPGNPWCASFLTWALGKAGHKMPGGGWAAVATWVRNAEQGSNGLRVVSAADARPGDIVAYDFGGQSDFGADGHIGFLGSTVTDGRFTALEGNNADAVNVVPRRVGDANTVFIRVEGDAPAGAAAPPAAAAAAAAAAAPAAPAAAPSAQGRVRRLRRRRQARRRAAPAAPGWQPRRRARRTAAPKSASGVFAVPEQRPRRGRAASRRAADAARRRGRPEPVPGRRRAEGADRRLDGRRGREARPPAPAARHGRARRVQPHQRRLRRRRLARLLPDARLVLGPGRIRGLRRRPREADRLVPRPGRGRQGPTRVPRPVDHRPRPVRRMDRRRRTPRRAVPRPLPTPPRRGRHPAQERAATPRPRPPPRRAGALRRRRWWMRPRRRGRCGRRMWIRHARPGGRRAASRRPRGSRCWRTRTSSSTTSACPTSRPARSTRASSPC